MKTVTSRTHGATLCTTHPNASINENEELMKNKLVGPIPPGRGVYCNRTLNFRSLRAIGYDMDYTLVHYNVEEWERCAYSALRARLVAEGWPVEGHEFDPNCVIRGLILDLDHGNIVKANRFGYIKRAEHGGKALDFDQQRKFYGRTVVDLGDPRWVFLNTFFSISEACMYSQLVTLLDEGKLKPGTSYLDLYRTVRAMLDAAHVEGELKKMILDDPERFVELDPDTPRALLDQKEAGKKLLLITNSEWPYTRAMMEYSFDPFLPGDMKWRDLFELVVVSARKPSFFTESPPLFEVVDEEGLLRPVAGSPSGDHHIFLGGNAHTIEKAIGLDGSDILYVGDHIYSDVHVSKGITRWRTAVIVREIEGELQARERFAKSQAILETSMAEKEGLEFEMSQLRLAIQRHEHDHERLASLNEVHKKISDLRERLTQLDEIIAPLARSAATLHNERWGLLMRTGNDKSHLARQIERHADVYTSRVSNFLFETPGAYFRSHRGSLPHDTSRRP